MVEYYCILLDPGKSKYSPINSSTNEWMKYYSIYFPPMDVTALFLPLAFFIRFHSVYSEMWEGRGGEVRSGM